jgi:predicted DNA-binding transcriptional regulator YafY
MRAGRLLSTLMLLQARGRMTAQEIADELEVSVRTVYRDIDALAESGVPLYGDRGPAGGYQLVDGYRTRLTGLTAEEAESLFLAGVPGPAAELGLGTVLAAAQLKVMAALPPELRSRAGRIRERFHLDAGGWFQQDEQPEHLAAVADAVWNQRAIVVRYRRWGGEVERRLEPLGLVLKAGLWYLVARAESGDVRTYRVGRILELAETREQFERPDPFDLSSYWRAYSDDFEQRLYPMEATVRLKQSALDLLPKLLTAYLGEIASAKASAPNAEGWMTTTVPLESIRHGTIAFLQFGPDLEVLGPPELRFAMEENLRGLARLYRLEAKQT